MIKETIAIASDHAGLELKSALVSELEATGMHMLDLGTHSTASVDYPDYADILANAIADNKAARGILICGSGIGISIAANRHRHIRAALCHDVTSARLSRLHNNANVIALGARLIGVEVAKEAVKTFLATQFEDGRHAARVAKLGK